MVIVAVGARFWQKKKIAFSLVRNVLAGWFLWDISSLSCTLWSIVWFLLCSPAKKKCSCLPFVYITVLLLLYSNLMIFSVTLTYSKSQTKCKNKSNFDITLSFLSLPNDWNKCFYEIYCWKFSFTCVYLTNFQRNFHLPDSTTLRCWLYKLWANMYNIQSSICLMCTSLSNWIHLLWTRETEAKDEEEKTFFHSNMFTHVLSHRIMKKWNRTSDICDDFFFSRWWFCLFHFELQT